jgi:hypothetical protein
MRTKGVLMTARILPFPVERTRRPKHKAPKLIDLFFGNINLWKLFRSLPDGDGEDKPKKRKSRQKK